MQVHVVGGGILGASAALALAQQGHEVTLFERSSLASGSTAKAAGILSAFTWNDHDYGLIAETRGLVGEVMGLALAAGEKAARGAWRTAESILIGTGPSLATLGSFQERLGRMGEEVDRLDSRAAAREFPGVLFEPGEEVLVAEEDGVIEAGDLFSALRVRLADEGVRIHENRPVSHLPVRDGRVEGADAVVVAGGAWTRGLLAAAGAPLPIQNYRTQLASLEMPDAESVPIVHDLVRHFYVRPESDATVLAGDGTELRPFEPDLYDEAADSAFVHSLAERMVARFERGGEARIRSGWAGLVVATPDRHPLCGPVPGVEGLFVLTGDNGFGLMRGLALGERLADAVGGRVDPVLDPARFGPGARLDFPMREGYGDAAT